MELKLRNVIENQSPGIRQNPYLYMIVPILEVYDNEDRNIGHIYINTKDIPEKYLDCKVYNIEPALGSFNQLYLRIVIL